MMHGYSGMGWGAGLFGGSVMLVVVALAVVGVAALVGGWRGGAVAPVRPGPERILDERLARGEIDIEEYIRCRDVLRTAPHHPPP
jgi:putative membrane protein